MLLPRSIVFSVVTFIIIPNLVHSKGKLWALTDETWDQMLEGEWMVEFFAPWCPACQQLEPLWKEFAEWSDDLSIKVASIDVTNNPGLSGRFMISTLPTIIHTKDGVFRQYRGARDRESFLRYIEDKQWSRTEPVSGWKSPQSYIMTIMSYFFKLSMMLRTVHNTMVNDYSIPYWGSYIVFGLSTIVIGCVLGLLIVCAIDFMCPSKTPAYQPPPSFDEIPRDKEEDAEYEGEDLIKDDSAGSNELRRRKD